jgi:hypothetical protein
MNYHLGMGAVSCQFLKHSHELAINLFHVELTLRRFVELS